MTRTLSQRRMDTWRGARRDTNPNLAIALDELDAWLSDPRKYDGRHKTPWLSMCSDVKRALLARGTHLARLAPALDELSTLIEYSTLGADYAARASCKALTVQTRRQLSLTDAVVGAFDDLLTAISNTEGPYDLVEERLTIFESVMEISGRSFMAEVHELATILDDDITYVKLAQHELDGKPVEPLTARDEPAGLSPHERLDLCRRLLRAASPPRHHAIWLGYNRARIHAHWMLEVGPISFFDWDSLLNAVEYSPESRPPHLLEMIPAELIDQDNLRSPLHWLKSLRESDTQNSVAVRVDLGIGQFPDAVSTAQRQVDALVKVAGFNAGGTSWRALDGNCSVVDGLVHQETFVRLDLGRDGWNDRTGDALDRLAPEIADHLPIGDDRLSELLEASGVVEANSDEDADPTLLLNDVRVIELLAARCSTEWIKHLKENLAIGWVRREVFKRIYAPLAAMSNDPEIRDYTDVPQATQLLEDISGQSQRLRVRYDVAIVSAQRLAAALPAHIFGARRLCQVAEYTQSPEKLREWIDAIRTEYEFRVGRLLRCRNSLAHGGPVNLRVAATIKEFSNSQAACTTSIGLNGILRGDSVAVAHEKIRIIDQEWLESITSATSVFEALCIEPTEPP